MLFSLGPITALTGAAGGALAGSRQGELDAINKKNLLMQGQQNQWNLNEQDALWEDKVKQALATSRLTQQQTAADSSLVDDKTRLAKQDLGLQYKIGGAQGELFDRTRDTGIGTGVNLARSAFDTSSQESQLLQVTQALNDIKANPGKTIANLTALGVAPSAIQGDAITGYKVNGIPAEQFLLGHRQTIMSSTSAQVGQPYAPAGQSGTVPESSLPAGSNKWTLGGSPVLFSAGTDGIARVDRPGNMYHGMPATEFEKVVKGSPSQTGPIPKPTSKPPTYPNVPTNESYDTARELIKRAETSVIPQDKLNDAINHAKKYEAIMRKFEFGTNIEGNIGSQAWTVPAVVGGLFTQSHAETEARANARMSGMNNILASENADLFNYAQTILDNNGKFPENMPLQDQKRFDELRNWSWNGGEGINKKRVKIAEVMLAASKMSGDASAPISTLLSR